MKRFLFLFPFAFAAALNLQAQTEPIVLPAFIQPEYVSAKGDDNKRELNLLKWVNLTYDAIHKSIPETSTTNAENVKARAFTAIKNVIPERRELGFTEKEALLASHYTWIDLAIVKEEEKAFAENIFSEEIKKLCSVYVATEPDNAEIRANNKVMGKTEYLFFVKGGTVEIIITKPGYKTEKIIFSADNGKNYTFKRNLSKN